VFRCFVLSSSRQSVVLSSCRARTNNSCENKIQFMAIPSFQFWPTETVILNPMNHNHGRTSEAERWEEHRELRDPIRNTRARGQIEFHSTVRNPGFGGPLSHHDRQASGEPFSFARDASSEEESRDSYMGHKFGHSCSSDQKRPPVHSSFARDTSTADESTDCWIGNVPGHSSSSHQKRLAVPELSQMPPPPLSQPTIEISPGVHVRLRGADETWKAIENDCYMPAECICCESTIFCIQNADYVLCPDCRVVSRMEGNSSHGIGGVGLGFKYEDLARWQDAIVRDKLY
jgi:hypothetical protein